MMTLNLRLVRLLLEIANDEMKDDWRYSIFSTEEQVDAKACVRLLKTLAWRARG